MPWISWIHRKLCLLSFLQKNILQRKTTMSVFNHTQTMIFCSIERETIPLERVSLVLLSCGASRRLTRQNSSGNRSTLHKLGDVKKVSCNKKKPSPTIQFCRLKRGSVLLLNPGVFKQGAKSSFNPSSPIDYKTYPLHWNRMNFTRQNLGSHFVFCWDSGKRLVKGWWSWRGSSFRAEVEFVAYGKEWTQMV